MPLICSMIRFFVDIVWGGVRNVLNKRREIIFFVQNQKRLNIFLVFSTGPDHGTPN